MSKFEAVLRRIRRLAPDEKCLVFSAFDEALTKLAVALRQNHVGCVRLVGGREACFPGENYCRVSKLAPRPVFTSMYCNDR